MIPSIMEIEKPFIDVSVANPIKHLSWEVAQYTSYSISIDTNHCAFNLSKSTVRRRYSEFTHLRKLLKNQHPDLETPSLPSKAIFGSRFDDEFIERRRSGLEIFLQRLFLETLYLSNRTVHLFVQSSLPMNRIQLIVEGRSEELVQFEPHLILNTQSHNDNSYSEVSLDSDVPDCCHHRVRTHSHVSQGARITLCSPALHVPKCEQHSQSFSVSDNSMDSDYYSVLAASSPKGLPSFLATTKIPTEVTNHQKSSPSHENESEHHKAHTTDNLYVPNYPAVKKVSFSTEVCFVPND